MPIDIDLAPITALLIDDSRYARAFIKTALQSFGMRSILEAPDGPTGLGMLERETVHLVIVDYDMSPMSGIDFTRYLRSGEAVACVDVPVIMVSGDASSEVVLTARNAGVTEFLVKPLSSDSLFRRLRAALTNPRPFVRSGGYVGPDRRTLSRPPADGADRRTAPPLPRPVPLVRPSGGGMTGKTVGRPPVAVPPSPRPDATERGGRRRFVAGETIFFEGEPGDVAYVVESGRVAILKQAVGAEIELGRIGANGVFGEMALIDGQPRMASARALDDTVCLVVPKATLHAQIGKTPDLVKLVLDTLLHDIRRMGQELGQVRATLERRRAAAGTPPSGS